MEDTTAIQDQTEHSTVQVDNGGNPKPRGFIPTATLILGLISIIVGLVIDFVLEFNTNFSTFWSECLVTALVTVSILSIWLSRGLVSLLLNVGILAYFWFVHISPFLFGR